MGGDRLGVGLCVAAAPWSLQWPGQRGCSEAGRLALGKTTGRGRSRAGVVSVTSLVMLNSCWLGLVASCVTLELVLTAGQSQADKVGIPWLALVGPNPRQKEAQQTQKKGHWLRQGPGSFLP